MKEKIKQNIVYILMSLILGIAIYSARHIGDKVTRYQAYNILGSVIRLSEPVHSSIEQLQKERNLTSMYLAQKNDALKTEIEIQNQLGDKSLKRFTEKLKLTELLLLSLPDSELEVIKEKISKQRSKLLQFPISFSDNYHFYNHIISSFELFLEKMYSYADYAEFQSQIFVLMKSELLKESVSQECSYVSYHISKAEIQRGEFPLILNMISNHIVFEDRFYESNDPAVRADFNQAVSSPEHQVLIKLRSQFDAIKPDLNGNITRGREYLEACTNYLNHFTKFNQVALKKLEVLSKEGKEKLKLEIIWATLIGIAAILVLVGIVVGLRKIPSA